MVKTTREELGEAYIRASSYLFARFGPPTPRALGWYWRKEFGLHHKNKWSLFGRKYWIEFPDDYDYTLFMLRFG